MLDHVNLPVLDLEKSADFYIPIMEILGVSILYRDEAVIGFGREHWEFGIEQVIQPIPSIHIAFTARDAKTVQVFHTAAMQLGGKNNGTPGLRPEYGDTYYAAFITDPNGHNIEAVCRTTKRFTKNTGI